MGSRAAVTYVFDAYCGWCYGFGPAMRQFADRNADRIDLRVISGGLFTGPRALPVAAYSHIPEANERIAKLTGVVFGAGYQRTLADGSEVMDSADAAAGLVALRPQDPARALAAAAAMQRAWYLDGRSLSDPAVYHDLAVELGLDPAVVVADFSAPATRAAVEDDFQQSRRLGVDSYPTLLVHTDQGVHRVGGPVSSADHLTRALDTFLAPQTA